MGATSRGVSACWRATSPHTADHGVPRRIGIARPPARITEPVCVERGRPATKKVSERGAPGIVIAPAPA